jgi:FKBP-type peptidyl-prolyl cis-trans isomerase
MTFGKRFTNSTLTYLLLAIMTPVGILFSGCDSARPEPIEVPGPRTVAESLYVATGTGLKYYEFTVGPGILSQAGLAVEIEYIMWLAKDSAIVNSSYFTGLPQVLVLGNGDIIPGMEEGITGMRTGGDRQLFIPSTLGFGESGSAGVPPNESLIVEIALLRVGVVGGTQ